MGTKTTYELVVNETLTAAGQLFTKELPNLPISRIEIKLTTDPVLDVGNYVANSLFQSIILEVDREVRMAFDGPYAIADTPSGPHALRYKKYFETGIASPSNLWEIVLPDAMRTGPKLLKLRVAPAYTDISDGAATAFTTSPQICITLILDDTIKGRHVEQKVTPLPTIVVGTGTYLLKTDWPVHSSQGWKCAGILLFNDDNGTAVTEAESKLLELEVKIGSQLLFKGKYWDLIMQTANRTGKIAQSTLAALGWALLPLQNKNIPANAFTMAIRWTTAQTAHDVNGWLIEVRG